MTATTDHLGRQYTGARCAVCTSLGRPDSECQRRHPEPACAVCDPYGTGVPCVDHPAAFLPRVECSQTGCVGAACYALRTDLYLCHACAVHRYGAEAVAFALAPTR